MAKRIAVSVSKLNESGVCVSLEDEDLDSIQLVAHNTRRDAAAACEAAAKKLEKLAAIARKIGRHSDPFKCKVQDEINGWSLYD